MLFRTVLKALVQLQRLPFFPLYFLSRELFKSYIRMPFEMKESKDYETAIQLLPSI